MVKVLLEPAPTRTAPDGEIEPFEPTEAVIVYVAALADWLTEKVWLPMLMLPALALLPLFDAME